jgi:hypothetical protein
MGEIITHLLFGIYLDVSRLNKTKKVLAIFGFMCYHIFRKGKENPKNQKGKFMEKIKLFEMYDETRKARIAAAREKAKDFVENEAIPAMIDAAKNMECSLTIQVPTGLIVENVIEIIAERVEYKNLTRDCRRLKYFWG